MRGAANTIAFRVKPCGDNLFATEILLLKGSAIVETRKGEPTLLGHAIGQAQELLGHWALWEIEKEPVDFFREVAIA